MKSREEIETETVGEPRVRKKAWKTNEKCFSDAFQMLLSTGWVRAEIKIIWFYDFRSQHWDRNGHWAGSNNGLDK